MKNNNNDNKELNLESMLLEEYKNAILKLRNVYFKIENKLKKEKGLSQEETESFLEKKFCEIVRNANLSFSKQEQQQEEEKEDQQEQQEQEEHNTTIVNKDTTNDKDDNNNNDKNKIPSYFQHFQ